MTKQKLLEYIQNLTPEQIDKLCSRLDLLERCLRLTDEQAIYIDTFSGKMFGK